MSIAAIDLKGVFTPPTPTPVPPTWTPAEVDRAAGYGPHLPLAAASPSDEHVGEVVSALSAAMTDLAGLPEAQITLEVGRRTETYLRDFAAGSGAKVNIAQVRTDAVRALTAEHERTRYARLSEVRQHLVDIVTTGQQQVEAAAQRRRQIPIPTFPAVTPGMDVARAQLIETQRATDSHLRMLAALEIPETAPAETLLARMQDPTNPHAQVRAQQLLAARLSTLRAEAVAARTRHRDADAARLEAVVAGFNAVIESRVPDSVKQAERTDRQQWTRIAEAVGRVLVMLAITQRAQTTPLSSGLIPDALATDVQTVLREARAAMREAWQPVWTTARSVRGKAR